MNMQAATSVEVLHEQTGIPKSTLVRFLNTLAAAGYIERISRSAGYGLTDRVLRLSAGYRDVDLVIHMARNILLEFTNHYKWPLLVAIHDRDAMVLRYTTNWHSPFSDSRGDPTNYRLPVLGSAVGLAHLAFCPKEEREAILTFLRKSPDPMNQVARDRDATSRLLMEMKKKGFASRPAHPKDSFAAIGLPIRNGVNVAASLAFRYLPSVMSEAKVARTYLPPLREAVEKIENALTAGPVK